MADRTRGMLDVEALRGAVASGDIDTVLTCFTDMQGRLMGKRVDGDFFCDEVVGNGIEACDYLLALDMEMDPVAGYRMANWEEGYGDLRLLPDVQTLRRIPWLERTALVLCDVAFEDGSPVPASPRQVLRRQVDRARDLGFEPMVGSELEFYLFQDSTAARGQSTTATCSRRCRTSSTTTCSQRRWTRRTSAPSVGA